MGLISRLMSSDNSLCKYSVIHMIPIIYTSFSAQNQQELIEIFNQIIVD